MRGVVLGGTRSGVGKTVATLATCRALADAGYEVQPAKAGPDFVDPTHHAFVTGTSSRTLDPWLQGEDGLRRNYYRGEGDVCVVEGVMGLYDGDVASTARVAASLDLPVVLVLDAKAGMESVGATALGFREYAAQRGLDVDVAGVLLQRAHGGRHERGIREALPEDLAYLGRIPPDGDLEIPGRHLGLEMGSEAPLDPDALDAAAKHLRPERLVELAREPPRPGDSRDGVSSTTDSCSDGSSTTDSGARIAVARDDAFCFSYPATAERLRELASVTTFSPVAGDALPACDAVYLPGGYPELHAERLAASPTLDDLAARAADGVPILGECGGLLALAESLTTADGERHEMAGVLPADASVADRHQALDHVELVATTDVPTASAGTRLCGHEFHYSEADLAPDARLAFEVRRGTGIDGERDGLYEYETLGTYCHVHPESGAFDALVEAI